MDSSIQQVENGPRFSPKCLGKWRNQSSFSMFLLPKWSRRLREMLISYRLLDRLPFDFRSLYRKRFVHPGRHATAHYKDGCESCAL